MKSFILHVYQRDITPESPQGHYKIVGVVECVEDEDRHSFTTPQELWEIVAEQHPENSAVALNKKRINGNGVKTLNVSS